MIPMSRNANERRGPGGAARPTSLFLFFLLLSPAAQAEMPRLVPSHDVTVDYSVRPENGPIIDVRVSILAGGRHLRITSADFPTTLLVDRQTETASILLPLLRAYSDINIARYDPENTMLRGAAFSRSGRSQIAGRSCTEWHARSATGEARACITDDGVILEADARSDRRGHLGTVHAGHIAYGAPPPALFQVPADFQESPIRLDRLGLDQ
jgi:hypothetical protein